jgi:hypothetical protein
MTVMNSQSDGPPFNVVFRTAIKERFAKDRVKEWLAALGQNVQ